MPTPSDIRSQRERLATNRATLQHYLNQRNISGPANVRPEVTHGIADARGQIRRIKATLRQWAEQVEDQPDDEDDPDPAAAPAGAQATGGGRAPPAGQASGRAAGGAGAPAAIGAGGATPGPPAWWERFRHHPVIFFSVVAFIIASSLFGCAAMAISAGADFGGFRQQLQEWGIIGAAPSAAPSPAPPPTSTSAPPARSRVTIRIESITLRAVPAPEILDGLEPEGQGDIELNIDHAGAKVIWPAEGQPRPMRVGETAEVGREFALVSVGGAEVQLAITALEKDPERGNENDLVLQEVIRVSPGSPPAGPQALVDQANGNAEITYTVTVETMP